MSLAFIIYLIDTVCGSLAGGMCFISFTFLLIWYAAHLSKAMSIDDTYSKRDPERAIKFKENYTKWFSGKVHFWIIFIWLIGMLIPTKDTAYKMLAAYGVESVASNPKVQELAGTSLEVLDKAMKDYLGDDKQEVKPSDK